MLKIRRGILGEILKEAKNFDNISETCGLETFSEKLARSKPKVVIKSRAVGNPVV